MKSGDKKKIFARGLGDKVVRQELESNHVIVGLYGDLETNNCIRRIGFITAPSFEKE